MPVLNSYQGCDDLNEGEAREVKLSQSPKTVLKLPLLLTEPASFSFDWYSKCFDTLELQGNWQPSSNMKLVDVSCQVSLYLLR